MRNPRYPQSSSARCPGIIPATMKAGLLAVVAGLSWGIGEMFTKQVLRGGRIGPLSAIAVRTTVAVPVLWLVYLIFVHLRGTEPRDWMSAPPATLAKLVFGSGLVVAA